MLLGIVRLLEDCQGIRGGTLFVIHIHDDEGVDDGRGLVAFKEGSQALRTAERPTSVACADIMDGASSGMILRWGGGCDGVFSEYSAALKQAVESENENVKKFRQLNSTQRLNEHVT
jgi:hypothetical protein